MNTNQCSQYRLKDITKSIAYHLQDDVLAIHLQLFVESVARVLVWFYAGLMTGEVVRPYLTQLVDWMTPKIPAMGDEATGLADTIKEEVLQ